MNRLISNKGVRKNSCMKISENDKNSKMIKSCMKKMTIKNNKLIQIKNISIHCKNLLLTIEMNKNEFIIFDFK